MILSSQVQAALPVETFGGGFLIGTAFQSIPPISWWLGTLVITGTHYSEPVKLRTKAGFAAGLVITAVIQAAVIYLAYKGFKSVSENK